MRDDYDDWYTHNPVTMTVSEETKICRVTYKGDTGKKFRVVVAQKPNPIGFRAKLPGKRSTYEH